MLYSKLRYYADFRYEHLDTLTIQRLLHRDYFPNLKVRILPTENSESDEEITFYVSQLARNRLFLLLNNIVRLMNSSLTSFLF